MKRTNLRAITFVALSGLIITACGGLGKMAKYAETIKYDLEPNPLIVRGDSVEININGNFPGKYFSKKAAVEITPTLTYASGNTPFEMVEFQGEDAPGNATVIPYETGKTFTYSDKVLYTPSMEQSELMLQLLGKQGSKEKAFEPFKLADGVITTPFMVMSDDKPIIAKDNFQRTLSFKSDAVINYLVNSSVVRPSELKDSDIKALDDFLNENGSKANYQFKSATITSYASPEGEISLNENLAVERANSAQKTITDVMKRRKVEAGEGFFNLVPKGEDWLGFKSKMEASNIADKALILRILEMYSDNTKREQEIKNLAATYVEISDKILPELRRSEIVINYDVVGLSDEQIIAYARSAKADTLTVEEMLYATTLTDDMNEQYAIYKKASETYPNDYRAFNNLGVIHLRKNELTEADKHFKMANDIEKNGIATNNMAVIQRLNGDRAAAKATLKGAAGAGDEVNYNLGIIDIQDGNYASAIQNMKGYNTFNKALAQVLSGSTEAAKTTLDQAPEKDTAEGQYLRAIIAARANDSAAVASSLKAAYALDASLKEKAAKDLEFRNFKDQIQ